MKTKSHSISGAFVFMLLGVFAVFSMLLVVLGAQAYRTTGGRRSRAHAEADRDGVCPQRGARAG